MDPLSSRRLRSFVWRAGRKLYQYARREGANDPARNGEYWLLDAIVQRASGHALTLLDVGANVGDWTQRALTCLTQHGRNGAVHAIEPAPAAHAHLEHRFAGDPRVHVQRVAIADHTGTESLYVVGELAGTNSLVDQQIGHPIPVAVTRVDDYLKAHAIEHVTFLKSDTEGLDLAVLRGGLEALARGRVDAWQFEYNARWIHARAFLRDVFELIARQPYVLGKLFGDGVELFDAWHPELERYFETNFVLLRTGTPLEPLGRRSRFNRSNVSVLLRD
ncbi:MAG TPA: FkbM family methyltransferase [Polyangiaceae bacterium]|nr:FkbM family methyltransferase [Polyangiaceae bacterium]